MRCGNTRLVKVSRGIYATVSKQNRPALALQLANLPATFDDAQAMNNRAALCNAPIQQRPPQTTAKLAHSQRSVQLERNAATQQRLFLTALCLMELGLGERRGEGPIRFQGHGSCSVAWCA